MHKKGMKKFYERTNKRIKVLYYWGPNNPLWFFILYYFIMFIMILGDFSLNAIASLISPIFFITMGVALLFTFGIYWLHWIYKTTQYTNSIKSMKQRTASAQVLLYLFIPFY